MEITYFVLKLDAHILQKDYLLKLPEVYTAKFRITIVKSHLKQFSFIILKRTNLWLTWFFGRHWSTSNFLVQCYFQPYKSLFITGTFKLLSVRIKKHNYRVINQFMLGFGWTYDTHVEMAALKVKIKYYRRK